MYEEDRKRRLVTRAFPYNERRVMRLKLLLIMSCGLQPITVSAQAPPTALPLTVGRRTIVYTSADSTPLRLTPADTVAFKDAEPISEGRIYVYADTKRTYQTMIGIGGALTDAAAETFAKLPAERQDEVIGAYYSTDRGIGYTLGRTNINSCDFSSDMYTYVTEGDKDLSSFTIAHDLRYKIPLIKRAMATTGNRLKLFASPWSPPAYMKDNNDML